MIISFLTALLPRIFGVVEEVVEDKDKANEIKATLQMKLLTMSAEEQKQAADIVLAEAKSEHKITAIWRPLLMLVIIGILANNFIIAPYAQAFFDVSVILSPDVSTLPDQLWDLLKVGIGGYIGGRSLEKVAQGLNINLGKSNGNS